MQKDSFYSRTIRDEKGCMLWPNGGTWYGNIRVCGKSIKTHRYSYTISIGPIPDGMCVLHKCDNPPCVNPAHLFLGTNKDNTLDMLSKRRHHRQKQNHCKRGHEFTLENTIIVQKNRNRRVCRKCRVDKEVSRCKDPVFVESRNKRRRERYLEKKAAQCQP